jgi:hypothetical protein
VAATFDVTTGLDHDAKLRLKVKKGREDHISDPLSPDLKED